MFKKLLNLVLKNPCEKCLVKSICNQHHKCEILGTYKSRKTKIYGILILTFLYSFMAATLSTLCLGVYEWFKIFRKLF